MLKSLGTFKRKELGLKKRLYNLPIEIQMIITDDLQHALESRIMVMEKIQQKTKV